MNRRFCLLDRDYVRPADRLRDMSEHRPSITLWDVVALALVIVILACAFAGGPS